MSAETKYLNLKWSVAHTDFVLKKARRHVPAFDIIAEMRSVFDGFEASVEEIISICMEQNVFVRTERRVS